MLDFDSPFTSIDQIAAWESPRPAAYRERIAKLRASLARIHGDETSPQADYAREHLGAEIERLERILKGERSIERERAALVEAIAAVREFEARPLPDDVDGEMRRTAERRVLSRRVLAAREAFVAAARASTLPSLNEDFGSSNDARAYTETADLGEIGHMIEQAEYPFSNRAVDLASAQGRDAPPAVAMFWAVHEAEWIEAPSLRKCFSVRWAHFCRRQGLPVPAVDLEVA